VVVASGVALFLILAGFMYFSFGGQR